MSIEIWDVVSGNRLFQCGSRDEALRRVLELLPSQGGIDGLVVTGDSDDQRLEGEALLAAVSNLLWGTVEQFSGEPVGLSFTVSAPAPEIVSAA